MKNPWPRENSKFRTHNHVCTSLRQASLKQKENWNYSIIVILSRLNIRSMIQSTTKKETQPAKKWEFKQSYKRKQQGMQTRVPTCVSSSDNPTLALVLTFSTDNFLRPEGLGATFRVEEEGITHRSCHNACRLNALFNWHQQHKRCNVTYASQMLPILQNSKDCVSLLQLWCFKRLCIQHSK